MQTDASEERLSKYELVRLLGSGGMGEVYLARDTRLQRQVAIKFVLAQRLGDPGANARLLKEARAAATLDHPGICPVYDVHVDDGGRTCIVMQYIEGETLAQRLARGALAPDEAVALAADIADALSAAHAHGLVHRDLKPQNVMLMPDGRPKLLDFGIAHAEVSPEVVAEIATHTDSAAWSPGAIVGTPAYMSPEQVLRKPVDGRSDLFSLGAVLFECLTGRPAFQAATDIDTWARVVYLAPPAPSSLDARVPAVVDGVVAGLLAKDPAARIGSATAAATALRAALQVPDLAPRRRAGSSKRRMVAVLVLAVAAISGFAGWRMLRARPLPPPPAAARAWYDRGLAHLRNGAYFTAKNELQKALDVHPEYPAALARLAEAHSELDEEDDARAAIVRIGTFVSDRSAMPVDEQLRLDAIGAQVLHDFPAAAAAYQRLADGNKNDQGVWLDLARLRQIEGQRAEARSACERALQINPDYAAAHLRKGALAAEEVRRDEALAEFAAAEEIYQTSGDSEGQAEALLQRAEFLDAIGDFTAARAALEEATKILEVTRNPFQQVRAALQRSSQLASSGDLDAARRTAEEAVATAQQNKLETVAAKALIETGTTLMRLRDFDEARTTLQKAIDLAKRKGAVLIEARGTLQLASVYLGLEQPEDARNLARGMLDFLQRGHHRRYEMIALSIIARAEEDRDIREAEKLARQVLAMARSLRDDREVALALDGLARAAAVLGSLPEALDLRTQQEQLHRQQQDRALLGFDLTSRADLLIRLGRFDQADEPLRELESGAAAGNNAFASRARRVLFLRALAASERHDFAAAADYARAVIRASASLKAPDTSQATAEVLLTYAMANRRPAGDRPAWSVLKPTAITREIRYWRAATLLAAGNLAAVEAEVAAGLADIDRQPSPEFEWRMAALAAAAASRRGDTVTAERMAARARTALAAVRTAWKDDAAAYERRADLVERKRAAGIS
jgi:tetratricopeptide (TPR) repeat protein